MAVPRDMQGGDPTEASEKEAAAAAAKAAAEAAAAKTTQAAETLQAQAEEERVAGAFPHSSLYRPFSRKLIGS